MSVLADVMPLILTSQTAYEVSSSLTLRQKQFFAVLWLDSGMKNPNHEQESKNHRQKYEELRNVTSSG